MHSNNALAIGRDLAEWSEPIIADFALEAYLRFISDSGTARTLSNVHCRMWRSLFLDSARQALSYRRDLVRVARGTGLSLGAIDAIDRAILDELIDCVFSRFHNSRRVAADHTRALLLAASGLVEVRLAA